MILVGYTYVIKLTLQELRISEEYVKVTR
jgi:hypothetical protein